MDNIGTSMMSVVVRLKTKINAFFLFLSKTWERFTQRHTHKAAHTYLDCLFLITTIIVVTCFCIAFGASGSLLLDNVAKIGENLILTTRLFLIIEESKSFLLLGAVNLILFAHADSVHATMARARHDKAGRLELFDLIRCQTDLTTTRNALATLHKRRHGTAFTRQQIATKVACAHFRHRFRTDHLCAHCNFCWFNSFFLPFVVFL
jgi:hypothetical protein